MKSFNDPVLGVLTFNAEHNGYEGSATWRGRKVGVTLRAEDEAEAGKAAKTAHGLFADSALWEERFNAALVRELWDLGNAWIQTGESEMTPDEFLARLTIADITVDENGGFAAFYDDGWVFGGHAVLVNGNLSSPDLEALMQG